MSPRHVVIDACCLGRRKTGNETYIRGLLEGLEREADSEWEFTVLTTTAHEGRRSDRFAWVDVPLGNFLTRNFLTIPKILKTAKADLYHGVYWTRFFSMPVPVVLMVHDLSFVSFPAGFHRHEQLVYANLVRACARRADHLLTVSNFSRGELVEKWDIPPEKITVTYDGLDACFQEAPEAVSGEKPYILYVGNLHPRKNIVRLLEAFQLFKEESKLPHRLRIVGQAAWMAGDVFRCARESGIAREIDFTGYVSLEELVRLYQRAAVVVYPSLYEGFGLPVLEAMACGCPVVCSNTTSIPEVAGDACLLIDPTSASDIAKGLRKVLENPGLAADMKRKGLEQSRRFTWNDCARSTLEAYRTVLQKS